MEAVSGLLLTIPVPHLVNWVRISTTFKVKRTKSARRNEIGHPEPGEAAPRVVHFSQSRK